MEEENGTPINSLPDHGHDQQPEPSACPQDASAEPTEEPLAEAAPVEAQGLISFPPFSGAEPGPAIAPVGYADAPSEQPLFQSFSQPEHREPVRIPHFGHVAILGVFAACGLLGASVLIHSALHFHLFGVTSLQNAVTDIHYTLGSEVVLYVLMLGACLIFFPLLWHKGLFAGLQWNGAVALRLRGKLFLIATTCFGLALVNGLLLPTPKDAPIDKIFRTPGAAWLLFIFGVTFAPFFEEFVFRGFLLPALCTAWDWAVERSTGMSPRPLDSDGQPQWSRFAMIAASILTSLPFAAMHGAQTGYSWGPFILLVAVSLALCWARLSTRSLAASVMVHASYNFLLFSIMMLGTGGFRHLDKM